MAFVWMKLTLYLCLRISEAIHGKTNGDLKPRRKLKNPHSLTRCAVLLFLSPQATELRTGDKREEPTEAEASTSMRGA